MVYLGLISLFAMNTNISPRTSDLHLQNSHQRAQVALSAGKVAGFLLRFRNMLSLSKNTDALKT